MAKKTFTSGIDALLSPTTKEIKPQEINKSEEQTSIMCRIPVSLKIRMEHYCTDKRIKQQELIATAINAYMDQNEE
jgi:hypothetical protein